MSPGRSLQSLLHYWRTERGAAAVEFAMFVLILAPLLLNLVDMGYYAYIRMQVENAAQAGAQAAWANCNTTASNPPSSTICPSMSAAITSAVQSTSLGSNVSWTNNTDVFTGTSPKVVDTYCPTTTNSLSLTNSTANCSTTAASPGVYAKVSVSYAYRPVFQGATVASLFPSTITATAYQRLY